MQLEIELNGQQRTFEAENRTSCWTYCGETATPARNAAVIRARAGCTVQIDGEPAMSCVTPAAKVAGSTVATIEGLGTQSDLHPLQQAFVDNSALQCGFCIPGMIMRSKALPESNRIRPRRRCGKRWRTISAGVPVTRRSSKRFSTLQTG